MLWSRFALLGVLIALASACAKNDSTASAEGQRFFWPEHLLERPNGDLWLVGIAQARGDGFDCGVGPEISEFAIVRLTRAGRLRSVSSVAQKEVEGCAAEATYLSEAQGNVRIDGLIHAPPVDEGGADRGMVRAFFDASGQARAEPSDKVPPEFAGIAVSRDATGYLVRVRWPKRPARALTDAMSAFEFKAFMGIAAQRGGKTVGAGQLDSGSRRKAFAVRVHRDGRPDSSFGNGGIVLVDIGRRTEDLYSDAKLAMTTQPDGMIVIAASIRGKPAHVFRLRSDGSLDPGFGRRGSIVLPRV